MQRYMYTRWTILFVLIAIATFCPVDGAYGQVRDARISADSGDNGSRTVMIGIKGGVVITNPRLIFPSLRVGESPLATGEISSRTSGTTGFGNRFGLEILIPFNKSVGLVLEAGLTTWSARFDGDSGRLPTRFDMQKFGVAFGLQGNIYSDLESFSGSGLRAIYLGGIIDIDAATLGNRLESSIYPDTTGVPVRGVGSFENNDPFRNVVSFRPEVGIRYGVDRNLELQADVGYNFALNSVFSSGVVIDNEFSVDNWLLQVGMGYRF